MVTVAEPLQAPKQSGGVLAEIDAVGAPVLFTLILVVAVQPLLEVTVTVYVPEASVEMVLVEEGELGVDVPLDQLYV